MKIRIELDELIQEYRAELLNINELIQEYRAELLNIKDKIKSDDAQGDHSYGREYDKSEENINEFIEKVKKLK